VGTDDGQRSADPARAECGPKDTGPAEKLFQVTRKLVHNQPLKPGEARSWRERYCVDMRTRSMHGPEDYLASLRSIGCGSGRGI
jgi:hypothetical protein